MPRKAVRKVEEEQATLSFDELAAGNSTLESSQASGFFSGVNTDSAKQAEVLQSDEPKVLTVSELDSRIREALDTDALTDVMVSGEVTGYRPNASGHVYFSLTEKGEKKESSSISCVMWKYAAAKYLTFSFKDGISVRVTGYVDFYPPSGKIQFIVKRIEPAAVGKTGLWLKKEEWRRELEAAGVIPRPASEKRSPPLFPKCVGVVTSKTGSVLQDIRNVLSRRYPLPVLLAPAQVQGEGAEVSIVEAISLLQDKADVIILARGGGSFEDLFVFNHPDVVRAVRNSKVPIITAIGHETDFTLADFAGDIRVPTPSAAAETVVPDRSTLASSLEDYRRRIADRARGIISSHKSLVAELKLRVDPARLSRRLDMMHQQTADLSERISAAAKRRISLESEAVVRLRELLIRGVSQKISTAKLELSAQKEKIQSCDPKKPLERGYALIKSGNAVIRSKTQLSKGDIVTVGLSDGEVTAKVEKIV
ncbi:MAG TPA: exodeoxyribonuclease VII large subunit [Methanocorpusculum sp.]|nr:exodeoxyribonuclease VII large subunit [Methanocorpusculum sp.]